MPLTTMIVRRIRPETSRFLLTITGGGATAWRITGGRGGSPADHRRGSDSAADHRRGRGSVGRDLDERQLVKLGLAHRSQRAEHDLLARRDALVDDPDQSVGDRSGLAHRQVIDPGR
jgi:hypothetical protein